jgi:hypothetical protein
MTLKMKSEEQLLETIWMIKMCEPLQGKIQFANWVNPCFRVKDIKSAIAFYKKYSFHPEKLQDDDYDLYMKMCHELKGRVVSVGAFGKYEIATSYNKWLFNYTFKDAIE